DGCAWHRGEGHSEVRTEGSVDPQITQITQIENRGGQPHATGLFHFPFCGFQICVICVICGSTLWVGVMSRGDPHWSEPKRVRASVRDNDDHIGYVTTVSSPNRDLTAFPEGSPYFEVVVSDLRDHHIALLQRFKQYWLTHCGSIYRTADATG